MRELELPIPHKILVGSSDFTAQTSHPFIQKPHPGHSLAHEDDSNNSFTLGGYVKLHKSGRIFAVTTVGHSIFSRRRYLSIR